MTEVAHASNASTDTLALTADIVSAFVSNNSLPQGDIANLIANVHASLKGLISGTSPAAVVDETPKAPAVSIRKSLGQDYLICLEDGKKFKSLKRHLRTTYNMSPEDYRAKWSLPSDYPMVAPSYAEKRSALAKASGLGQMRRNSGKKAA